MADVVADTPRYVAACQEAGIEPPEDPRHATLAHVYVRLAVLDTNLRAHLAVDQQRAEAQRQLCAAHSQRLGTLEHRVSAGLGGLATIGLIGAIIAAVISILKVI